MYGIGKLFETKYGGLIFSLFAGGAYFIILCALIFAKTQNGGLLAFFFFPAITAGAALIIIKTVKKLTEAEKYRSINLFLYAHLLLIIIGTVFFADLLLSR